MSWICFDFSSGKFDLNKMFLMKIAQFFCYDDAWTLRNHYFVALLSRPKYFILIPKRWFFVMIRFYHNFTPKIIFMEVPWDWDILNLWFLFLNLYLNFDVGDYSKEMVAQLALLNWKYFQSCFQCWMTFVFNCQTDWIMNDVMRQVPFQVMLSLSWPFVDARVYKHQLNL